MEIKIYAIVHLTQIKNKFIDLYAQQNQARRAEHSA